MVRGEQAAGAGVIDQHRTDLDEFPCATDLVAHIAEIEAGWTLGKPWKVSDEEAMEEENRREIREMLERWAAHGIAVLVR